MTFDEYEKLMDINKYVITINDLNNKENRVLLYGYTSDRKTFEVSLESDGISCCKYGIDGSDVEYMEIENNFDYVPNKRVYPYESDYEFCKLLMERGVEIPFLPYDC